MSGYGHASHPRLPRDPPPRRCTASSETASTYAPSTSRRSSRARPPAAPRSPSSVLPLLPRQLRRRGGYYERLCRAHPGNDAYRLHHAQPFKARPTPRRSARRNRSRTRPSPSASRCPRRPSPSRRTTPPRVAHDSTGPPDDPDVAVNARAACSRRASSRRRAPSSRTRSRRSGTRLIWRTTSRCVTTA